MSQNAEFLHRLEEEKDLQSSEIRLPQRKPDVSGNSRERSEKGSILGKNPDDEALRNIINKLSDEQI